MEKNLVQLTLVDVQDRNPGQVTAFIFDGKVERQAVWTQVFKHYPGKAKEDFEVKEFASSFYIAYHHKGNKPEVTPYI